MLNFFPSLYPDEFWYSILCRYHVRAGYVTAPATIRQLFPDRIQLSLGNLFPNNLIYLLSLNLPEGIIDVEDIILNHTLYKYCFRMRTYNEKLDMLDNLKKGIAQTPTNLWRTAGKNIRLQQSTRSLEVLKFCPICKEEDTEAYGESYWHLTHQIPLISVCIKHKCKLIEHSCARANQLSYSFILPNDYLLNYTVDLNLTDFDLPLARILSDYLHMPLQVGPTYGHNNLISALGNNGYGLYRNKNGWSYDLKQIHQDLYRMYGNEITNQVFGDNITTQDMDKLKHWKMQSPERYALLSTLIFQPTEITFGEEVLDDFLETELIRLSQSGKKYNKTYVAETLGVSTSQLEIIAKDLNVSSFWIQRSEETKTPRAKSMEGHFTEKEKKKIVSYYKSHGFKSASDFIRYCVSQNLDFKDE